MIEKLTEKQIEDEKKLCLDKLRLHFEKCLLSGDFFSSLSKMFSEEEYIKNTL